MIWAEQLIQQTCTLSMALDLVFFRICTHSLTHIHKYTHNANAFEWITPSFFPFVFDCVWCAFFVVTKIAVEFPGCFFVDLTMNKIVCLLLYILFYFGRFVCSGCFFLLCFLLVNLWHKYFSLKSLQTPLNYCNNNFLFPNIYDQNISVFFFYFCWY